MKKRCRVELVGNGRLKMRYGGERMVIEGVLGEKGSLIWGVGVNKRGRVEVRIGIEDIMGGVEMVVVRENEMED